MAQRGSLGFSPNRSIVGSGIFTRSLGPNEDGNLTIARAAVDLIVTGLETDFHDFNISEIYKAGSLGHGTAVPGHYDIDLVIYSRDISPEAVYHANGFKNWIDLLKLFMERKFQLTCGTPGYNHRSVQFPIQYSGVTLRVNLLVSPYWNTPREFYDFLRRIPKEQQKMFTVCASKWQIEFFQNVNQKTKEYIRRAKAWRNSVWSRSGMHGRPSSYLMSLLVARAYENAGRDRSEPAGVTRALKALVQNYGSMNVYWADGPNDCYKMADIRDLVPAYCPRLIDPANPANNVWETGFTPPGYSSVLVSKIDTIDLSRPI